MRRRGVTLAIVAFAFGVAVLAAWHDLTTARRHLDGARRTLEGILDKPGSLQTTAGRSAALVRTRRARQRIDSARKRLDGSAPILITRVLPGLRRQREGAFVLMRDATTAVRAGEKLLHQADELAGQSQLAAGAVP